MDKNLYKHILWEAKADWQKIAKLLVYDSLNGKFYRTKRGHLREVDQIYNAKGQLVISIQGQYRLADRLAYGIYHRKVPLGYIKHKNGNIRDNRIDNIQLIWLSKLELAQYGRKYGQKIM